MNSLERRKKRELKQLLRQLSRRFGVPGSFYKFEPGTFDVETGENSTPTVTVTEHSRLITFTTNIQQKFEYSEVLSTNFKHGGIFEVGDKVFIFEGLGTEPDIQHDYIVQENRRYNIHRFQRMDFDAGYMVHGRETQNQTPNKVVTKTYEHVLDVQQTVEIEP